MANSGIKATQAGTSLRAMLTRLSTGSWEAGVAMEKLGIRLDDGHGNMKSLMQVMDELRGSFGDLKMSQADFTAQMNRLDSAKLPAYQGQRAGTDPETLSIICEKLRRSTMEVAMEVIEEFQTQVGKLHQECEHLRAENNRLEDENENLRNEIAALSDRVDELSDEIGEPPTATLEVTEPKITIQSIRTAIQQAYQDAAHDDCTGDQILHMVWGFEYLLQRLGVE